MHRLLAESPRRSVAALAGAWGLFFLADGVLRLALDPQHWLYQVLLFDALAHAREIFAALRWPLMRIEMIVPFMAAWEIAIALFMLAALFELAGRDENDVLPGSTMLILGLGMAASAVALLFWAAFAAGHGVAMAAALGWLAVLLAASLVLAMRSHAAAEDLVADIPRALPVEPFHRR